jgi:hypothetical protein
MPADYQGQTGAEVGAKALEAVKIGTVLNHDHPADADPLRFIGACRTCGILSYETGDGTWRHVPAIEECDGADRWLQQRQHLVHDRVDSH